MIVCNSVEIYGPWMRGCVYNVFWMHNRNSRPLAACLNTAAVLVLAKIEAIDV